MNKKMKIYVVNETYKMFGSNIVLLTFWCKLFSRTMTPEDLADLLVLEHELEINHSTALDAFTEAIKRGISPVKVCYSFVLSTLRSTL